MNSPNLIKQYTLGAIALVSLGLYGMVQRYAVESIQHPGAEMMARAVDRTERSYQMIRDEKIRRGLIEKSDAIRMKYPLLGVEYSEITTTLGSYESKIASSNPEFAALVVRTLIDQGIDSTQRVGVTLSGSFPALGVSVLCALEELNIAPVMISSLGASTYGANETGMSWADIELLLNTHRILSHRSIFVTPGADADTGGGLPEGGIESLNMIAARTGSVLHIPTSYKDAVSMRESVMTAKSIAMLINIGGNHAVLGNCAHAPSIPNGFHDRFVSCREEERGVLMRLSEKGIPVLHFLNIKDIAQRYEIEENAMNSTVSRKIYYKEKSQKTLIFLSLILISGLMMITSKIQKPHR